LLRSQLGGRISSELAGALAKGPLLVDYIGHGFQGGWRGSLDVAAAARLGNGNRPPVFVSMTCLNGFFHDVHAPSLAEALLLSPGGATAVWASSGLTEFAAQHPMNQAFIEAVLGAGLALGDAAIAAKAATADKDVRRTWILFGDPTVTLRPVGRPLVVHTGRPVAGCALPASPIAAGHAGAIVVLLALVALGLRGRGPRRRRFIPPRIDRQQDKPKPYGAPSRR
jgi:hypothetical protein